MAGLAFTAYGIHWFAMAHRHYIDSSTQLDGNRFSIPERPKSNGNERAGLLLAPLSAFFPQPNAAGSGSPALSFPFDLEYGRLESLASFTLVQMDTFHLNKRETVEGLVRAGLATRLMPLAI
jgi:hypothetical protein